MFRILVNRCRSRLARVDLIERGAAADAAFAVAMNNTYPNTVWQDTPANYHAGACGFLFADGHAEIHKWRDPQTLAIKTTFIAQNSTINQRNNMDVVWVQERTTAKK